MCQKSTYVAEKNPSGILKKMSGVLDPRIPYFRSNGIEMVKYKIGELGLYRPTPKLSEIGSSVLPIHITFLFLSFYPFTLCYTQHILH